jgi:glutamyl-tRNA synthetase
LDVLLARRARERTGMDHGPEMAPLFALIGEEKARRRLKGESA